jgi:hypothetical protein
MLRHAPLLFILMIALACGRVKEEQAAVTAPDRASDAPPAAAANLYAVTWVSHNVPATMKAGATADLVVRVRNDSAGLWKDPKTANPSTGAGRYAVRMSHRWRDANDEPITKYDGRWELPRAVGPGEEADVKMAIQAPAQPGEYRLQMDLVEELVAWFEPHGATPLIVPVRVVP